MKWLLDIIKAVINSKMSNSAKVVIIISLLLGIGVGYVYIDYRKRDKQKIEIASEQNAKFNIVINSLSDKEKKDSLRFDNMNKNIQYLHHKVDTISSRQIIDGMIVKELTKNQKQEVIQRIEDMENIFYQLRKNNQGTYINSIQPNEISINNMALKLPEPVPELKKNE